jgi:uncharacterized membrane protein
MILRLIFWIIASAYAVFLMVSRGSTQVPLSVTVSALLMGAGAGLALGLMFANRAVRKTGHKNRFLWYSQ